MVSIKGGILEVLSLTFQARTTEVENLKQEDTYCEAPGNKATIVTAEAFQLSSVGGGVFGLPAVILFGAKVKALIESELGMNSSQAAQFAERAMELFSNKRLAALPEIAQKLEISGIGVRWNSVLHRDRSKLLAAWIAPFVSGNVLDMLCGDGSVGNQLAVIGNSVTLTERQESYDFEHGRHELPFLSFDFLTQSSLPTYDTVLLSTVLHHEVDPETLLSLAVRCARRRIIIVENCLENAYPSDFQLLMDVFFNHCLNQTALHSPGQHRDVEEWSSLASMYGNVYAIDRREDIPGIPLSHHLIVVDLENAS